MSRQDVLADTERHGCRHEEILDLLLHGEEFGFVVDVAGVDEVADLFGQLVGTQELEVRGRRDDVAFGYGEAGADELRQVEAFAAQIVVAVGHAVLDRDGILGRPPGRALGARRRVAATGPTTDGAVGTALGMRVGGARAGLAVLHGFPPLGVTSP